MPASKQWHHQCKQLKNKHPQIFSSNNTTEYQKKETHFHFFFNVPQQSQCNVPSVQASQRFKLLDANKKVSLTQMYHILAAKVVITRLVFGSVRLKKSQPGLPNILSKFTVLRQAGAGTFKMASRSSRLLSSQHVLASCQQIYSATPACVSSTSTSHTACTYNVNVGYTKQVLLVKQATAQKN